MALTSVALLGAVGFSALANANTRSDLAVCASNLRQVGRAFHMWASDHGGENPWWVSFSDGGSYIKPGGPQPPGGVFNVPNAGPLSVNLRNNPWLQFAFINQELRTPALLACPAHRLNRRAETFSNEPTNGYFHFEMQNRATSYFIGLHAFSQSPSSMLSGDKSILPDTLNQSCSANVGLASMIELDGSVQGWGDFLHPKAGNILVNDGHVEELSAAGLSAFLSGRGEENGATHFMKPQ